ncbi:MAG TPA: ThiF family adenylyltransferase, partial [Burkholderiaceae bacterium]|nr:ThiF family adenylyltransferase [Burkholderiaceae bacterium]
MDFERRFGGLVRLYGEQGAHAIYQAHVVVIGLGGVGSWAAESLARSGVGRLTLIDMDHVAESNINRQVMALDSTLGQAKVLAMRDRIALINPNCVVTCIEEFVTPENIAQIMPMDAQAVIDACDQVHAKVALAAWAKKSKCNFLTVGAAGGKRFAHLVDVEDLSKVT